MKLSRKKSRHFLAMWDMYGLECIYDLTQHMQEQNQWEKEKIWSVLQGKDHEPKPLGPPLPAMILRAKVNGQRRYEIYEFMSELSLHAVQNLFKDDPNFIAKWIRENGVKVYSDYGMKDNQVIF